MSHDQSPHEPPAEQPAEPHTPLGDGPKIPKSHHIIGATLLGLIIMCGLFMGSGSDGDDDPDGYAEPAAVSAEDLYISSVRVYVDTGTDSELITAGHQACAAIDEMGSVRAVATYMALEYASGTDLDMEMTGFVIAAAVRHFCPEHQDSLDAFTSGY